MNDGVGKKYKGWCMKNVVQGGIACLLVFPFGDEFNDLMSDNE